jgi:hypothetical protein
LIRDGRMEKFYWYITHSGILMVLHFRNWALFMCTRTSHFLKHIFC